MHLEMTRQEATAYDIAIQDVPMGEVKRLTDLIERGAGMRPLYFANMLKSVQVNLKGEKQIKRRIGAVRRNMDRLHQWAVEIAPQNDVKLLAVARAMWTGLIAVKGDLEVMQETLLIGIALKRSIRENGRPQ